MEGGLLAWLKHGPRTRHGYAALVVAHFLLGVLALLVGYEPLSLVMTFLGVYNAYKMQRMSFPRTY